MYDRLLMAGASVSIASLVLYVVTSSPWWGIPFVLGYALMWTAVFLQWGKP